MQQEAAAASAAHTAAQQRSQLALEEAREGLRAEAARHAETRARMAEQAEELQSLQGSVQQLSDMQDAVKVHLPRIIYDQSWPENCGGRGWLGVRFSLENDKILMSREVSCRILEFPLRMVCCWYEFTLLLQLSHRSSHIWHANCEWSPYLHGRECLVAIVKGASNFSYAMPINHTFSGGISSSLALGELALSSLCTGEGGDAGQC